MAALGVSFDRSIIEHTYHRYQAEYLEDLLIRPQHFDGLSRRGIALRARPFFSVLQESNQQEELMGLVAGKETKADNTSLAVELQLDGNFLLEQKVVHKLLLVVKEQCERKVSSLFGFHFCIYGRSFH